MKALKLYDIKFSGLKNGKHQYRFHLNRSFFDNFDYDEFEKCDIDILINFNKSDNLLEFNISTQGTVNVPCDISGEHFDQNIEGQLDFIIKFGESYNDDREDLIIIPYNSHRYNIAQQIYESVILSIPAKRVHPEVISGKMATENTKFIINYNSDLKTEEDKEMDPRWAVLKKILTDKKK